MNTALTREPAVPFHARCEKCGVGPLRLAAPRSSSDRGMVALGINEAWRRRVCPHARLVARSPDRTGHSPARASVCGTSPEDRSGVDRVRAPSKRSGSTQRAARGEHGSPGVGVQKMEELGASGITKRHHGTGSESGSPAGEFDRLAHPDRAQSDASQASDNLVQNASSAECPIAPSPGILRAKLVNDSRPIEYSRQLQCCIALVVGQLGFDRSDRFCETSLLTD